MFFRTLCALVLLLLVAGCGKSVKSPNPTLESMSLKPKHSILKDSEIVLAKTPEGIRIVANKPSEGGLFEGITIQRNGLSKTFAWQSSSNPTYYPIAEVGEFFISNENKDELAVILTKGHGTGIMRQEIHVLDVESLSEIPVESPADAIQREVKSELTIRDRTVLVQFEVNGVKISKEYDKSAAASWSENVAFGEIVIYEIDRGNIIAYLPGAVSPAPLIAATAVVSYDKDLKVNKVELFDDK